MLEGEFRENILLRLASIEHGIKDTNRLIVLQNGRIGKLEAKDAAHELADAHAAGLSDGKALAVLTRTQLAIALSVMSAMGAVGGLVARFWQP